MNTARSIERIHCKNHRMALCQNLSHLPPQPLHTPTPLKNKISWGVRSFQFMDLYVAIHCVSIGYKGNSNGDKPRATLESETLLATWISSENTACMVSFGIPTCTKSAIHLNNALVSIATWLQLSPAKSLAVINCEYSLIVSSTPSQSKLERSLDEIKASSTLFLFSWSVSGMIFWLIIIVCTHFFVESFAFCVIGSNCISSWYMQSGCCE